MLTNNFLFPEGQDEYYRKKGKTVAVGFHQFCVHYIDAVTSVGYKYFSCFACQLLSYEDSDPGEYYVEKIHSHKDYGEQDGWWLKVDLISFTGKYENTYMAEVSVLDVYNMCNFQLKDPESEEENLLVEYAKGQKEHLDPSLAAVIAEWEDETVQDLFPSCQEKPPSSGGGKKKKKNVDAPPAVSVSNSKKVASVEESKSDCNHDTYTLVCYSSVTSPYYWEDGRKYHGLLCNVEACQKQIQKPSDKTPLYVCRCFALDKIKCRNAVCHECFLKKQEGGRPKRARTGQ